MSYQQPNLNCDQHNLKPHIILISWIYIAAIVYNEYNTIAGGGLSGRMLLLSIATPVLAYVNSYNEISDLLQSN